MNVVNAKSGVEFTKIAPGGFRILSAIDQTAQKLGVDLVITSGCDGLHSGPDDPHHRGEAYDVRSHDLDAVQKEKVLAMILLTLNGPPSDGDRFFGFLESANTDDEHFHFQVRKGTTYP